MLERLELLIGKEKVELLKNKTVLVLGLGGVGGYAVESLARSGIGTLILVDYDKVDITNLNRQLIATSDTIGTYKTDAFENRIHSISKDCNVIKIREKITPETFSDLLTYHPDFFIDACDTVSVKETCIQTCLEEHIPFIASMGTGNRMDPTKLKIIDLKKTSGDPISKKLRKFVKDERLKGKIPVICSEELPKRKGKVIASNSFVPPTAGLYAAFYAVKTLLGEK